MQAVQGHSSPGLQPRVTAQESPQVAHALPTAGQASAGQAAQALPVRVHTSTAPPAQARAVTPQTQMQIPAQGGAAVPAVQAAPSGVAPGSSLGQQPEQAGSESGSGRQHAHQAAGQVLAKAASPDAQQGKAQHPPSHEG